MTGPKMSPHISTPLHCEIFGVLHKKADFDRYTDEELHAEATYAELLIFRAALSIIEEESIMSLVRGMLKIRSSYQIFK